MRKKRFELGAAVLELKENAAFLPELEALDRAGVGGEAARRACLIGNVLGHGLVAMRVDGDSIGEASCVAGEVQGVEWVGEHADGKDAGGGGAAVLVAVTEEAVISGALGLVLLDLRVGQSRGEAPSLHGFPPALRIAFNGREIIRHARSQDNLLARPLLPRTVLRLEAATLHLLQPLNLRLLKPDGLVAG